MSTRTTSTRPDTVPSLLAVSQPSPAQLTDLPSNSKTICTQTKDNVTSSTNTDDLEPQKEYRNHGEHPRKRGAERKKKSSSSYPDGRKMARVSGMPVEKMEGFYQKHKLQGFTEEVKLPALAEYFRSRGAEDGISERAMDRHDEPRHR